MHRYSTTQNPESPQAGTAGFCACYSLPRVTGHGQVDLVTNKGSVAEDLQFLDVAARVGIDILTSLHRKIAGHGAFCERPAPVMPDAAGTNPVASAKFSLRLAYGT